MNESVLLIITSIFLLIGLAGVWLPFVPGIPFMFVVALIYAIVDKFTRLSSQELMILGGITVASLIIDYLSGVLGAKFGGASKKAILYGTIGLILGLVFFPPLGSIIGLFLGVFIVELSEQKDRAKAIKAATGSLLGSLAGIAINIVLALIFFGLFLFFVLK